jgi:hypothetical protein
MKIGAIVAKELKHHMPFTAIGALGGIVLMYLFRNISHKMAHELFYVFHPSHVLLSALATAGMYRKHNCPRDKKKCSLVVLLLVGYIGAIGIATLSDSVVPYWGELLLGMHNAELHAGFIEKWWLISTMAIIGIMVAYINPSTKFPHAGHVLVSTWASLFHVLMFLGSEAGLLIYAGVFIFLFFAVWLPCCVSDIIFPLLFVGKTDPSSS